MTTIPILDLTRARQRIEAALRERWNKILDGNSFISGPEVKELECAFTGFLGAARRGRRRQRHRRAGDRAARPRLAPGDEVLVPAFSFFATAEAVVLAGGVPVFCDIDAATYNLDPAELERRATAKTVGVIGVHLYGRPFDTDSVGEICRRRGWFWSRTRRRRTARSAAAGASARSATSRPGASIRPRTSAASATAARSPAWTRS